MVATLRAQLYGKLSMLQTSKTVGSMQHASIRTYDGREEGGGGWRSAWDGVMRGTRPFDRADQLHAFWTLHLHLVNVLVTEGHDVFPILESLRYVLCVFGCVCVYVCV